MDLQQFEYDMNRIDSLSWWHHERLIRHWWALLRGMESIPSKINWWWQRRTRGFDDREWWNLDGAFSDWVVPRLRLLQRNQHGYPDPLTEEEWVGIIREMVDGFEIAADVSCCPRNKEQEAKVERAGVLFGLWWQALWD